MLFCASPVLFGEEETPILTTLVALGVFELGVVLVSETKPGLHEEGKWTERMVGLAQTLQASADHR